jgi:AcrR family transcriptional regulator
MAPAIKKPRRTYLRAEQRREQLLSAAAELVEKRGWEALGMVPLAEAAGVSRQLVYEHFENLHVLRQEVTRALFEGMFRVAGEALARHPGDFAAAARASLRVQLELPRGVRLALRELIAGPADASVSIRRRRARARERVTDLWAEPIRRGTGVSERDARALAWMLIVASWGLFDLVADETFSADEAVEFFVATARGAIAALERDG